MTATAAHGLTVIRRWYTGGAGPRVRGQALRERLIRTGAFAIVLAVIVVLVLELGGPWLTPDDVRTTSSALGQGAGVDVVRFLLGCFLQILALFQAIAVVINGAGLIAVVARWMRWKQQR